MKVLKTSLCILGSIIGAGFATGKEIFTFFAKYGVYSILFLIPLFFLFYIFNLVYLKFGSKFKNCDLQKTNRLLCKDKTILNLKFNFIDVIMFLTFLILSSAMFSAIVELLNTYLSFLPQIICYIFAILITYILIKCNLKILSNASNFLVPIIIFCILLTAFISFKTNSFATNFGITNLLPLPFMNIAYCAQNTLLSSFIVMQLGKDLNEKQQKATSFVVAFIITFLILIGILCFLLNPKLAYMDMPFAMIAISINPIFSLIYAVVLLFSVLTTYATTITSLKEFFKCKKSYNNDFFMIILILLLSLLNFGKIVDYLYPIIGIFGIIYFYKIFNYHASTKACTLNHEFIKK